MVHGAVWAGHPRVRSADGYAMKDRYIITDCGALMDNGSKTTMHDSQALADVYHRGDFEAIKRQCLFCQSAEDLMAAQIYQAGDQRH